MPRETDLVRYTILGTDALEEHYRTVITPTWNFAGRLERDQDHFMNAASGLAAEAGEVLDLHKKCFYHTKKDQDFFREKVVKELGDVYYYLLKVQDLWDLSTEEILAGNKEKLESRHPELGQVDERFGEGYIR